MARFAGRVALGTVAANGIGFATAKALADQGAKVLRADIEANQVTQATRQNGTEAFAVTVDIADPGACEATVGAVTLCLGRLEFAVSNAVIPATPQSACLYSLVVLQFNSLQVPQ